MLFAGSNSVSYLCLEIVHLKRYKTVLAFSHWNMQVILEYDWASVDNSFFTGWVRCFWILSPIQQRSAFNEHLWEQSLVLELIIRVESQHDRIKHESELAKMFMESYSHCIAQYVWAVIALAWNSADSGFLSFVIVLEGSQCIRSAVCDCD